MADKKNEKSSPKKKAKSKAKAKAKPKAKLDPLSALKRKLSKKPTLADLVQGQIYLFQYTNELNQRVSELEMKFQTLLGQSFMQSQESGEIKGIMEALSQKLGIYKEGKGIEGKAIEGEDFDPPEAKKMEISKKQLPLHDDVMKKCPVCGSSHHVNAKACPQCGFNKSKKER